MAPHLDLASKRSLEIKSQEDPPLEVVMAKITGIENLGSLVAFWVQEGDEPSRMVLGDHRGAFHAIEGMQADADAHAREEGLGRSGYIAALEVEILEASWGGLEGINVVGYNEDIHQEILDKTAAGTAAQVA